MQASLFDLTGRRVFVTGSSQGIGLALARGLTDAGAEVVLNGRDPAKLSAAAANLGGARFMAFDVTDHSARQEPGEEEERKRRNDLRWAEDDQASRWVTEEEASRQARRVVPAVGDWPF